MQGVKIQVADRTPLMMGLQLLGCLCMLAWLYALIFPAALAWLKYAFFPAVILGPIYAVSYLSRLRWVSLFGTQADLRTVKGLGLLGTFVDLLTLAAVLPLFLPLLEAKGKMHIAFPFGLRLWFWGTCLAAPLLLWLKLVLDGRMRYWLKRCAPEASG